MALPGDAAGALLRRGPFAAPAVSRPVDGPEQAADRDGVATGQRPA